MAPDRKTKHCNDDHGSDHVLGAMERYSSKRGDYVGDNSKGRKQDNVDFGVIETVRSIRVPSTRLSPMVGVNTVAVSGEYSVPPRSGAAPKKKLRIIITPLKRKNQKLIAFRRGNARSRAPICKGMMKFAKPK